MNQVPAKSFGDHGRYQSYNISKDQSPSLRNINFNLTSGDINLNDFNDTAEITVLQENYLPENNLFEENPTEFQVLNLGELVVTPEVLERVAFEKRMLLHIPYLPRRHKNILSALLRLYADNVELHFSQVKLSEKLRIGISTVQRALNRFKELGILQWVFRGIKKTCLYTFSPFMHSKVLREKFVRWVSGFKYVPMVVLLAQNTEAFSASMTSNKIQISKDNFSQSERQFPSERILISKSLSLQAFILKREKRVIESLSVCNTTRAYEGQGHALAFSEKDQSNFEEFPMSQVYSQSLALAAAASVKSIKLTTYGRLIVGCYPADAIRFADVEMGNKKTKVQKPFALFSAMCKQYCDKNNMRPNFSRLQEFKSSTADWQLLTEIEESPASVSSEPQKSSTKINGYVDPYKDKYTYLLEPQRNPMTFDRQGNWDRAIEAIKGLSEKLNPFQDQMLELDVVAGDQAPIVMAQAITGKRPEFAMISSIVADWKKLQHPIIDKAQPETKNQIAKIPSQTPMPKSTPTVPFVPLSQEEIDLIEQVIGKCATMPDTGTTKWLLNAVSEMQEVGANHPRLLDGTFRQGISELFGIRPRNLGSPLATTTPAATVATVLAFGDEPPFDIPLDLNDDGLYLEIY